MLFVFSMAASLLVSEKRSHEKCCRFGPDQCLRRAKGVQRLVIAAVIALDKSRQLASNNVLAEIVLIVHIPEAGFFVADVV